MAYINPDILQEDWDDLTDWTDGDTNGAVSEIDPAGQLYLDDRALTDNGRTKRSKNIGSIGSGDYYVEIRFKGDKWDGYGTVDFGMNFLHESGRPKRLNFAIGNGFTDPSGDGIIVFGSNGVGHLVYAHTWDNNWHTIVFFVHNSGTDVDIWIDKDPATEPADITDADCDYVGGTDGNVNVRGFGTPAGDGEYHIDYWYIGTELAGEEYTLTTTVGAFTLTGIAATFTKALNIAASVGSFTLTGIASVLKKVFKITAGVGSFILTGIGTALNLKGWLYGTKHSTSWTEETKHSASWTEETKHTANYTNETKN